MSKTERLAFLRARNAIISAARSAVEVIASPAPHIAPARISPILSVEERVKLSADVLADKISRDLQTFDSPAARGWLIVVA